MIRDVIERFRYRFQLWSREGSEDYFGRSSDSPVEEDYVSYYTDRDQITLLTESTMRMVGRTFRRYSVASSSYHR